MPENILPILGASLILAFLFGLIAKWLKVPKVTGYIMAGVCLGPTGFGLIDENLLHHLDFLMELALGLIMFDIGCEFQKEMMKKIGWDNFRYMLVFCAATFVSVFSLALLLTGLSDLPFIERLIFALMAGFVALAAAPPTTLIVIKEYDSQGPLSDHILVYLAIGTLVAIVGSRSVLALLGMTGLLDTGGASAWAQLGALIWLVAGSLVTGVIIGLLFSHWEQHMRSKGELFMAIVCMLFLGLTAAHLLQLDALLICLFMGFAMVNSSDAGEDINSEIKNFGLSIYAFFFVLAGSHIHLQDQIQALGVLGIAYIVARTGGFLLAGRISGKLMKESHLVVKKYLGLALLSHAGAALGIVTGFDSYHDPALSAMAKAVVSSVFLFEILGPILLRQALVQATEVKVGRLMRVIHNQRRVSLVEIASNFLVNIGISHPVHLKPEDSIWPMVDSSIAVIDPSAGYAEVLKIVNKHHHQIYPVVDQEHHFEGIISMTELQEIIFDPLLSQGGLVIARDLTQKANLVGNHHSIQQALDVFKLSDFDILPVVEPTTGHYLGTIQHKRLLWALKGHG